MMMVLVGWENTRLQAELGGVKEAKLGEGDWHVKYFIVKKSQL